MSITKNEGGVLRKQTEFTTNVGGVLRSLKEISVVKDGVLRTIFTKNSETNLLDWTLTGEISGASIISVSDDGFTVSFSSGSGAWGSSESSNENCIATNNYIALNAGDVVSHSYTMSTSGVTPVTTTKLYDESGTKVAELNNSTSSYTVKTTGRYRFAANTFGAGPTFYSASATLTITITRT